MGHLAATVVGEAIRRSRGCRHGQRAVPEHRAAGLAGEGGVATYAVRAWASPKRSTWSTQRTAVAQRRSVRMRARRASLAAYACRASLERSWMRVRSTSTGARPTKRAIDFSEQEMRRAGPTSPRYTR